jgi:hypothetical protein
MQGMKEFMRHIQAWAGIQRTRHEHRCAVTQPHSQALNATVLKLYSHLLRILKPPIPFKPHLKYFVEGIFSILIPGFPENAGEVVSKPGNGAGFEPFSLLLFHSWGFAP